MKTKLFFLVTLLAIGGSLFGQGTPVKNLFGSGVPNANLASVVGTTYVDQSASPATVYTCTAVTLTPTVSQCTWTIGGGSGGGLSGIFFAGTGPCGGATNCVQWVDDDATDNCGAATTAWLAQINAYNGGNAAGHAQVYITGSGTATSKAFKFNSCNLAFTGVTSSISGGIDIHNWATLDAGTGITLNNFIQLGVSGLVAYGAGMKSFDFSDGVILGCLNVTVACIESKPYMATVRVRGTTFRDTGAGNATPGNCTNFSIQFGSPTAEDEISGTTYNGTTTGPTGVCFSNNTDLTTAGGQNTLRFNNNHITNANCGSIAHVDGGSHSNMENNSMYGYGMLIRVQNLSASGPEGGWMISNNSFDANSCVAKGQSAAIHVGGNASSTIPGPISVINNETVSSAHMTNLMAVAGDFSGAAQMKGVTAFGNMQQSISPLGVVIPSNITCPTMTCFLGANQNYFSLNNANTGWAQAASSMGYVFLSAQVANVGSTNILGASNTLGVQSAITATCYLVVTTVGTTSTLPSCTIGWTDNISGAAVSRTVTATQAGNTLGTFDSGTVSFWAKAGTQVTYSTTGYASTGTPMQYSVLIKLTQN